MLEAAIEKAVCDYANARDIEDYKFNSMARRSVPDRLFTTPQGFIFLIEFKRTGEKATVPQAREHARLRKRNIAVYVCDNVADGKRIIDHIIRWEDTQMSRDLPGNPF